MNRIRTLLLTICALAAPAYSESARADEVAPNKVSVSYSNSRSVYAKSVPTELLGEKGTTRVFRIKGKNKAALIAQYPWYTHYAYLGGKEEDTVVRFGPWPTGHTPRADQMALGIYRNGKLIRKYSTLQMHQIGSGIRLSVSHYIVFDYENPHFRRIGGNGHPGYYVFEITGVSGKVFQFDLYTGKVKALPATYTVAKTKLTGH